MQVGWDESTAGERQPRVSLWEIEPLTTFPMYPSSFPLRLKRPWPPGLPSFNGIQNCCVLLNPTHLLNYAAMIDLYNFGFCIVICIPFLHVGMKEDDLGMNSPLMWLRGDNGDHSIQSLNFQGIGVAPWIQPRLDASMLGLQNDTYQAMAVTALQDTRAVDLQFRQPQSVPYRPANLMQPPMPQQSQPQPVFHQSGIENQPQSMAQSHSRLLQQQLQHSQSFANQNHQQLVEHQHAVSSMCQQRSFSDSNGNPTTNPIVSPLHSFMGETSHLLNLPRVDALSSAGWPPKRVGVDSLMSPRTSQYIMPPVEQFEPPHASTQQNAVSLPPFPGRECSLNQEGSNDPQTNLLFGVNIDSSSLLMQNGMSSKMGVGSESNSTAMHFSSSGYLSTAGNDFSLSAVVTPSNCVDESGFLQSPENVGQENPPIRTFVKVSCVL